MVLVLSGVAATVAVFVAMAYNHLVRLRNASANAFGTLDVQLKQRFDLVPNVEAVVSAYMQHERTLLESLTALRAQALAQGTTPERRIELDGHLALGLHRLVVAVEAYPDLKASPQFDHLQRTLVEVESQIAAARRACNSAVTELNDAVQSFPTNVVAGLLSFGAKPLLETPDSERARLDVAALLPR